MLGTLVFKGTPKPHKALNLKHMHSNTYYHSVEKIYPENLKKKKFHLNTTLE